MQSLALLLVGVAMSLAPVADTPDTRIDESPEGIVQRCPSGCIPGWPCLPDIGTALACSEECVHVCQDTGAGTCTNQSAWHCSASSGMVACDWGCV